MQSEPKEHQRRPARRLTCEEVAAALPGIVDGNDTADRRVQHHVATCLRCQAELVHYRRLLRALHQLRTEYLEPAPGVLTGILASLEEVGEQGAIRSLLSGHRAAYIGGVAVAATAAAGAGTLVLVSRASHRRKGMRLAG
jgi:anti-sigma factor RsiW